MRHDSLEKLRRRLLGRRESLLLAHEHAVTDAAELRGEREPDWEDAAALATTASVLERLGEAERTELGRVDDALARMERGTYEECVSCHQPIEIDRLETVPETDRCVRCAGR
jgi:DnaK suppressor protein